MTRQMKRAALLCVFLLSLAGCRTLPLSGGLSPDTPLALPHASPNFEERRANYVILHHTSNDDLARALATLTHPLRGVSSHYLIGRQGEILQLVAESRRAWHAGASWWGGQTDMNSASIGIELDNNGTEPFPPEQIDALLALLADIRQRHVIPRANFLAHGDIAPARKSDPSHFFPWARLAAQGFGLWCEAPPPPPPDFDFFLALTAFGYDPREPRASLLAFRRHFHPAALDENPSFSPPSAEESALLACLLEQRKDGVIPADGRDSVRSDKKDWVRK
ncbi:MAG: N-acetylmuramoyl-L-alanine amidase [Zoogloeaceae bacterium]|jgi:N-acetylmuramoyl-L-alanine amidase|nr:N-acetylmuramoyl-L-alanine amidase [Zoogloeaceae bacterium]